MHQEEVIQLHNMSPNTSVSFTFDYSQAFTENSKALIKKNNYAFHTETYVSTVIAAELLISKFLVRVLI